VKVKRLVFLIAVLTAVLAVSAAVPTLRRLGNDPTSEVPTYVVSLGDFSRKIHAEGNLKAADATLLGPPAKMRRPLKIAWLAPDGSRVKEGDVVIRFDPTDLEEELKEGRHDRATTDSQITQKAVREEGSRRNLERDTEVANLELDYAEGFQSKDTEIFSRTEIIEAEIDKELASTKKEHAEQVGRVHGELAQAELDLLAIERRKAELTISQAEEGLQDLEVRAPHDGIFVLKKVWGRRPEVGQMVWGGNAVAEIPEPATMEAQIYVLEADAGGLEVDLPATILLDARPGVIYQAQVNKVAALAQRRNHRVPIQYFAVTLALEETVPEVMKPGQRVQAVLTLDELEDVLTVPRQAVFEEDGKKIVYARRGGRFEPVEVELGPAAPGRLVIEKGLEEGDRIALRDPTRPADESAEDDQDAEGIPVVR
jgi:RND family efflux transporter MFP subunit